MSIELPEIRYNYPENGNNPFDLDNSGQYFVFASGYTRTTKDLDVFGFQNLLGNIPIGYKTIIVCEKAAIITAAGIVKRWNHSEVDNTKDEFAKYFISSNIEVDEFVPGWGRVNKTFSLSKPDTDRLYIGNSMWNTFEEAAEYALNFTSANPRVSLLISHVNNTIPWH